MGLAGLHPLVQDHRLLLECLDKVGVIVVQSTGLGVELVAPSVGVGVDSGLGRVELVFEVLLLLLQSLDLLEPPVPVHPGDGVTVVVEDLHPVSFLVRGDGPVVALHTRALALGPYALVSGALAVRSGHAAPLARAPGNCRGPREYHRVGTLPPDLHQRGARYPGPDCSPGLDP